MSTVQFLELFRALYSSPQTDLFNHHGFSGRHSAIPLLMCKYSLYSIDLVKENSKKYYKPSALSVGDYGCVPDET